MAGHHHRRGVLGGQALLLGATLSPVVSVLPVRVLVLALVLLLPVAASVIVVLVVSLLETGSVLVQEASRLITVKKKKEERVSEHQWQRVQQASEGLWPTVGW